MTNKARAGKKWFRLTLRTKLMSMVLALAVLAIGVTVFTLWYSRLTDVFIFKNLGENMAAFKTAGQLESTLIMQKGYLTYFFQDHDPAWIQELEVRHQYFLGMLAAARRTALDSADCEVLEQIHRDYVALAGLREEVIELYRQGETEQGYIKHSRARSVFFRILDLCAQYREKNESRMSAARERIRTQTRIIRGMALAVLPTAALFSLLLCVTLIRQLLGPIARLARAANLDEYSSTNLNEVQVLSRGVHSLIENVDQTRSELETSRHHLVQATKLASVGKLAASVAHSIRNPLTSVKMRLFSLEKGVQLTPDQREDFAVISGEIRHIDNVLRNFLEFSRRPKLKLRKVYPSEVVDMAADLMGPRFESRKIDFRLVRKKPLPPIEGDPDQLKEALVNLLVNASEAVGEGGVISLQEGLVRCLDRKNMVEIRIRDNGPGVLPELKDQVFQPFFSTKDEGTGLGLSITARIIDEHEGSVNLEEPEDGGTEFVIRLPYREEG